MALLVGMWATLIGFLPLIQSSFPGDHQDSVTINKNAVYLFLGSVITAKVSDRWGERERLESKGKANDQ